MDTIHIADMPTPPASPAQRRALYRFLIRSEPEAVRDLIRVATAEEASQLLSLLSSLASRLPPIIVDG